MVSRGGILKPVLLQSHTHREAGPQSSTSLNSFSQIRKQQLRERKTIAHGHMTASVSENNVRLGIAT